MRTHSGGTKYLDISRNESANISQKTGEQTTDYCFRMQKLLYKITTRVENTDGPWRQTGLEYVTRTAIKKYIAG